jgi:hypothetical protein
VTTSVTAIEPQSHQEVSVLSTPVNDPSEMIFERVSRKRRKVK